MPPTAIRRTKASAELPSAETLEQVLLGGDLSRLTPDERLRYYSAVCQSLGLNPLTKPLEYITLDGKLRLYVRKDGTEQLRRIQEVSITALTSERLGEVFVVTATAKNGKGRTDVATGAVFTGGLRGSFLADALMKAETKAKRRVTLSICGLGMLDESEVGADAIPLDVDPATGEMHDPGSASASGDAIARATAAADAHAHGAAESTTITAKQRRRLFAIAGEHGWTQNQLKRFLVERCHCDSTSQLPAAQYDDVCTALQDGPPPAAAAATVDPDQPF